MHVRLGDQHLIVVRDSHIVVEPCRCSSILSIGPTPTTSTSRSGATADSPGRTELPSDFFVV